MTTPDMTAAAVARRMTAGVTTTTGTYERRRAKYHGACEERSNYYFAHSDPRPIASVVLSPHRLGWILCEAIALIALNWPGRQLSPEEAKGVPW